MRKMVERPYLYRLSVEVINNNLSTKAAFLVSLEMDGILNCCELLPSMKQTAI